MFNSIFKKNVQGRNIQVQEVAYLHNKYYLVTEILNV